MNKVVRYHLLSNNQGCLRKYVYSLLHGQYNTSTLLELAYVDTLALQARLLREEKQCVDIISMISRYNSLPSAAQPRSLRAKAAESAISIYANNVYSLSDPGIAAAAAASEPAAAAAVDSPRPAAATGTLLSSPPSGVPGPASQPQHATSQPAVLPATALSVGGGSEQGTPYTAYQYDVGAGTSTTDKPSSGTLWASLKRQG